MRSNCLPPAKTQLRCRLTVRRQEFCPNFFAISTTHHQDAVYPATIVGLPPMEDFYIGGAIVKLFRPIFKLNFPEIMDIALLESLIRMWKS